MSPSGDAHVPGPLAIFLGGELSPREDRISDALLDLRPGVLIVFGD